MLGGLGTIRTQRRGVVLIVSAAQDLNQNGPQEIEGFERIKWTAGYNEDPEARSNPIIFNELATTTDF